MKLLSIVIFIVPVFMVTLFSSFSAAQDILSDNSRVLAVVPVSKGGIDKDVYRQFDTLVPELQKISKDNVIRLECRYSGKPEMEQDVLKAYQLAARIEKYLREKHLLELDLWISITLEEKTVKAALPVLSITVLADEIKRLNTIQVKPYQYKKYE